MITMNKDEMLKEALDKLEAERERVIALNKQAEVLIKELKDRDNLILKIKEYVGTDNFRAMLEVLGEVANSPNR